jgi:hypothetical protein
VCRLRRALTLIVGALLIGATSACSSAADTSTAPAPARCTVRAEADRAAFLSSGGSGAIRVFTNRECAWTAGAEAGWLAVTSPEAGQGDGSVRFTVAANSAPSSRTGAIAINDHRVAISQEGRPCEYQLSATRVQLDARGGDRRIDVAASNGACRWATTTGTPWIAIIGAREVAGSGAVTFRVGPTGESRTGTLTVAGQQVVVEQSGVPPPEGVRGASQ